MIDPTGPKGPIVRVRSVDDPNSTREVTATRARQGGAEISPDGRSIVFTSLDDQNQPTLTVCDLETCSSPKTFPLLGQMGRWMPDNRALAYVDPRTQSDIWVQPLDGGPPRQLTTSPLTDRRSGTSTGPRMASGSLWPAHEWRATSCCSVDSRRRSSHDGGSNVLRYVKSLDDRRSPVIQ